MRLTLRTLLAYLDDILEPPQAKEIGSKISESGFAASLVNRIRDVMRRRRLTAPELEGPGSGLDPNIVAEYLDNVLPPEKVPDVEKVCLESDVHLAEVAACHQILTAALGEPVQILHNSREHMYTLGPDGRSSAALTDETAQPPTANNEPHVAAASVGHNNRSDTARATADSNSDFERTIPDFLRQRPLWKRALPYTVVGLIAVAWIGLLFLGGNLPDRVFTGNSGGAADGAQAAADANDGGPLAAAGEKLAAADAGTKPPAAAQTVSPLDGEPLDPPPPRDEAVDAHPVVDAKPPQGLNLPAVPAGEPPANAPADKVVVNVPGAKPKPGAVPQPVAAPAPAGPALQYNSPRGILLRYDNLAEDWMVMAPRAIIHPGERFASPEPFDAVINISNALARATLIGGSAVRILPPTNAAGTGFGIEQGRVILQSVRKSVDDDKNGAEEKPIVLAIAVRDELWRLELLSQDTVCGIEIVPVQPSQPDQELGGNSYLGRIFVVAGSVRFADGTGKVQLINGPGWRSLTPADRADDENAPAPATGPPLLKIPDWLDPVAKQSFARTVRRSATLFEREFDADRPLSENVYQLIKDDRPYISALAVKCLALTGDYAAMAEALNAAHEESRMAAIVGLRNWLPQNQDNGELLKQALQQRFAQNEAGIVLRLLWGYSNRDATERATSEQLVAWLDHSRPIVRELAFYHIFRLTGTKYDYVPMRPAAQRRAAINRWEERIRTAGALIAPAGSE